MVKFEPLTFGQLAQVALGVSIILGSIRLASVASGDFDLAVTILKASGYVSPLVNTALTLMPTLMMLCVIYVIPYRFNMLRVGQLDSLAQWAWTIAWWLFIIILILAPWYVPVVTAGFVGIICLLEWRRRRRVRSEESEPAEYVRKYRRNLIAAATPLLISVILPGAVSRDPWVPKEVITTTDETIQGFVIEVGDPWVTILVNDPRQLVYVEQSNIKSREVCPGNPSRLLDFISTHSAPVAPAGCADES